MTVIATRAEFIRQIARGKGVINAGLSTTGTTTTAGAAASGFFSIQIETNNTGTTLPNTLVEFQQPPAPTNELFGMMCLDNSSNGQQFNSYLARIYKIGTQVLTSTGDQFTHDAATFPVTRTILGAATQAVQLIPMFQVTTATTTTPAVLTLKTAAGGTGYKNQAASNVVGTKTFTMPNAATTINSCFIPSLETGDSAVTDIVAIQTNTAASAGAVTVWGIEIICPLCFWAQQITASTDMLFGGLAPIDIKPAAATSGTATSYLCRLSFRTVAQQFSQIYAAALNAT